MVLGVGDVVGIVSLTIQLLGSINTVIGFFDRVQNAPDTLLEFKRRIVRLEENLKFLEGTGSLTKKDLEDIERTLLVCDRFFKKYEPTTAEQRNARGTLRAVWLALGDDQELRDLSANISTCNETITHGWLRLIDSKISSLLGSQEVMPEVGDLEIVDPNELDRILLEIKQLYERVKNSTEETSTEEITPALRRCMEDLARLMKRPEILRETPDSRRRGSRILETLPTTLELKGAKRQHQILKLQHVNILARDTEARIIRYRSSDKSIRVTHIIPYGSIPWTLGINSTWVSFLTNHGVTVIDSDGYHAYSIDPKYSFESRDACEKFQKTIRERDLLETFEPVRIKSGKKLLAQRQLIRCWRRSQQHGLPTITMTYLATRISNLRRHEEPNISDFGSTLESDDKHHIVYLRGYNTSNLEITFEDQKDVKRFMELFERHHPGNAPPRLELGPLPIFSPLDLEYNSPSTIIPTRTQLDSPSPPSLRGGQPASPYNLARTTRPTTATSIFSSLPEPAVASSMSSFSIQEESHDDDEKQVGLPN